MGTVSCSQTDEKEGRSQRKQRTRLNPILSEHLFLVDWKRQVQELYAAVRHEQSRAGWLMWREGRDRLFRHHPQSPIPAGEHESFDGIAYFDYDGRFRVEASFDPLDRR